MAYAALTDLYVHGLSAQACGPVTQAQQLAALQAASDTADGYFAARYKLPLVSPYPSDLVQKVCEIAAWTIMNARGYNPAAGADANIKDRYLMAIRWLEGVERQRVHPKFTESGDTSPGYAAPMVVSKARQGWGP